MFQVKKNRTNCSNIFYMSKFSQRIKEIRLEKGMSRQQLADAMFVSVRLISYWENGQRECDFDTLIKLSNVLGESTDYLLGKTDL